MPPALQSGAVACRNTVAGACFRDLVRRILQRCEERGFEAIVLYTDKPGLYEPHGFVTVPEHRFVGPAPAPVDAAPTCRTLDMTDERDLSLLRDLLEERAPVSQRFSVSRNTQTFLLNTALVEGVTLSLLPAFPAVVAWSGTSVERPVHAARRGRHAHSHARRDPAGARTAAAQRRDHVSAGPDGMGGREHRRGPGSPLHAARPVGSRAD